MWALDGDGNYEPYVVLAGVVLAIAEIMRRKAATKEQASRVDAQLLAGRGGRGGNARVSGSGTAVGGRGGAGGAPGAGQEVTAGMLKSLEMNSP